MAYSVPSYREQLDIKILEDLRKQVAELPAFCKKFFISKDSSVSVRTRFSYAQDLRVFFKWLIEENTKYSKMKISEIPFEAIENITSIDIDSFMAWLSAYESDGIYHKNTSVAKRRKLSTLRSFFHFYEKHGLIKSNPATFIESPKLSKTVPITLNTSEVSAFLSVIRSGTGMSDKELDYHEKTKVRDLTIFTILLYTGIRVSELVGLNISDFDFENKAFRVTRKGDKGGVVYYNDEVEETLNYYLDYDRGNFTDDDNEYALFLSLQRRRITVKAVENLCKKYSALSVPLKKVTPHKMRSTFGTTLYNQTGDIYLTAEALGHSSVDTTRKYYASINSERSKKAIMELSYNK